MIRAARWLLLLNLLQPVRALAQEPAQPLRLLEGTDLWTITDASLRQFVDNGTFRDQRLLRLVSQSGWPDQALRTALVKPYGVEFVALARFLDSPAGTVFLQRQSQGYRPFPDRVGQVDLRAVALRAAILADAHDGTISALGILRRLPVPLVLDVVGSGLQRCSDLPCEDPQQCRSVLSWLVFLPACLQAAAAS